jgi:heat shock protein HslJ
MVLDGKWVVESMRVEGELVAPGSRLTLEVEGGRVTGKALNRIVGSLDEHRLFEEMATTRMAGPPEIMAEEAVFLRHLSLVDEAVPDRVHLTAEGVPMLVLRRREPDEEE